MTAHGSLVQVFARFSASAAIALRSNTAADLSYASLYGAACALAARLTDLDGSNRTPILIYGHRDPRYVVAYWACLLTGRAAVPVEPDLSANRIADIAHMTGATRVLLGETPPPGALTPACAEMAMAVDANAPSSLFAIPEIADDDAAYILFSSGTTGKPKGIAVTYANVADFAGWCRDLTDAHGAVACVSGNVRYCFDVSLFEMWMAWNDCAPMSVLDHRELWNMGHYVSRFADHGLSTWVSTPALAEHFCKHPKFKSATLPDLKVMYFCGEVLSKNLVAKLMDRFPDTKIINTFGPTEATVAVTEYHVTRADLDTTDPLPIGYARAGTTLSLDKGEIVISGASVAKGYIGATPEADAKFFGDASYRTGDWGRADADGNWHFIGRQDREVKLDGYRIDLNAVEQAIRAIASVADVVVNVTGGKRANTLSAYVLGATDDQLTQVSAVLADRLAPHMIPRFWRGAETGPFNANGKLDRKAFVTQLDVDPPVIYAPQTAAKLAAE